MESKRLVKRLRQLMRNNAELSKKIGEAAPSGAGVAAMFAARAGAFREVLEMIRER